MSKIVVAYWTQSGNTEAMANAIGKGIEDAGGEARVVPMEEMSAAELENESVFALGCPAMGAEELDDSVVEPFVQEVEKFAEGKKIALFGSYDWGDGEWMRTWAERMSQAGAEIVGGEGLIANLEPDDEAVAACEALGKAMVG